MTHSTGASEPAIEEQPGETPFPAAQGIEKNTPAESILALSREVSRLPGLPTLPREAFWDASCLIEDLVHEVLIIDDGNLPDFEFMKKLISKLRRIGEPSAAERIAAKCANGFERSRKHLDAAYMCNLTAAACFDQGITEEAERHMERSLALLPRDDPRSYGPTFYNNYGILLIEQARFNEAIAMQKRAMEALDSCSKKSYLKVTGTEADHMAGSIINNMGWTLVRQSKLQDRDPAILAKAVALFKKTLTSNIHPRTSLIARGNLAEGYLMQGDTEKASVLLATLEKECLASKLEKFLPEVYRRHAQLWAARENMQAAVWWLRKAMRSSLIDMNPKQELRIVEVFFDMLRDLLSCDGDSLAVLEGSGAAVLDPLLGLLRSKDTYTGGDHSRKVANLSRKLAVYFADTEGHKKRWIKQLELAALLHDVGKLMVPWSLLNRVRPLTPRDLAQLRRHALTGEEMLRSIGLANLAVVAGEHHERPDGTGYPRGKKGTSFEASIVAVADAYEAMTSLSRIYKQPRRRQEALDEVRAGAGTQFDPRIADALERIILGGTNHGLS